MIIHYNYIVIQTGYTDRLIKHGKDFLKGFFIIDGKNIYPEVVSIKEYNKPHIYLQNDWEYIKKYFPEIQKKTGFIIFKNTSCKNYEINEDENLFTYDDLFNIIISIGPGGKYEYCCIYNLFYKFKIYELNNKKLLYVQFDGTESG